MKAAIITQQAQVYRIEILGRLETRWEKWFDGLSIYPGTYTTSLLGVINDQSALHGILDKLRDLNITLISVSLVDDPDLIPSTTNQETNYDTH